MKRMENKMRKIIALLLLVVMTLGIVACGGNTPTPTPPSNNNNNNNNNNQTSEKVRWEVPAEGFDTDAEITITFSHTMGKNLSTVLERYIKKFNEIFPNITIEHSQIGGYDEVRDQTNKQLTAGNQPNIAYCYPDHVALYNVTKKVIPLDNLIESTLAVQGADGSSMIIGLTDAQKSDFIKTYYNEGAAFDAAGTMYTMPLSKSTEANCLDSLDRMGRVRRLCFVCSLPYSTLMKARLLLMDMILYRITSKSDNMWDICLADFLCIKT